MRSNGYECDTASLSTFLRVFRDHGMADLRFRKVSEHKHCDECEAYKKQLRANRHTTGQAAVIDQYIEHLAGVWLDRQACGFDEVGRASGTGVLGWLVWTSSELPAIPLLEPPSKPIR